VQHPLPPEQAHRDNRCTAERRDHRPILVTVGYFDTIDEAEAAVIAKRKELFTHNDADRVSA